MNRSLPWLLLLAIGATAAEAQGPAPGTPYAPPNSVQGNPGNVFAASPTTLTAMA